MKRKRFTRYFSVFMILNILFEIISPTMALALTNGTTQPEFIGFEPANSSEMVDLFTGDYKYNIPLMDVEGYPLNISYHAGPNMESEASWVGLGWSLNPGVLNRVTKGLPDDFNGDQIKSETHMKPHASMGIGYQKAAYIGANVQWDNGLGVGANVGIDGAAMLTYNNYKGFGIEVQLDGHASLSGVAGPAHASLAGGVGMTMSSMDGGTLSYQHSKGFGLGIYSASIGEGTSINTRSGAMNKTYFGSQSLGYGGISVSFSTSHTIPVGSVAYSPTIGKNYKGYGFGASYKGGFWGCVDLNPLLPVVINAGLMVGFKGFYNKSEIEKAQQISKSYGYMYLENADENSLMDFNRIRDGVLTKETPNISMASLTYDIYSATAQGMASNFRPTRSDVGVVHDNVATNKAAHVPLGFELGIGVFMHLLLDVMKTTNNGKSGLWSSQITNNLNFIGSKADPYFEKVYFKQLGEITSRSGDLNIGGETAISPKLIAGGFGYEVKSNLPGATGTSLTRSARDKRVNDIVYLTGEQAKDVAFEKGQFLYLKNNFSVNPSTRLVDPIPASQLSRDNRNGFDTKSHLSEISITKDNGARYYYSIPVYNVTKKRVMFNASDRKDGVYNPNGFPTTNFTNSPLLVNHPYQIVEYSSGDLFTNLRGLDNLFQVDETPQYATSYLLTSIVSPDYVDVTGNGPTYDDLGTYTKFNYSKESSNYNWREPYCVPGSAPDNVGGNALAGTTFHANLDKGLLSDDYDDKAFFEYGEREVFYVHSIETKNYVAQFKLGNRTDSKDAVNEDGGIPANFKAQKLEAIELFSKSEIINNPGNPVPIKTVHFTYDSNDNLCPGTFNGTNGKLTLKSLYFTYGNSDRAALSPYEFFYADNDHDGNQDANFPYHPKAVDRWGCYKPNTGGYPSGTAANLNNIEAPYAEQNKPLADSYAAAWNLTDIITPTGSKIKITYEADDYAYIQNEQAGQMLKIYNIQNSINTSLSVPATYGTANTDIRNSTYLIVDMKDLRTGITSTVSFSNATNIVKNKVLKLNKDLYFRCYTKIGGPANSWGLKKDFYDFIPGYATAEEVGVFSSGNAANTYVDSEGHTCYRFAYVKLQPEIAYGSTEVNPICLAGWDFTRSFLPRVAYPGSEPANMGDNSHKPLKQIGNMLVGIGVAMADFISGIADGPNFRFYYRKFSSEISYDKSFVRAYVPNKNKIGGGHRVKQIVTSDEWDAVTGSLGGNELKSSYGQTYDYTTKENGLTISSGVSSYEPLVGGEENSMHQPIKFEDRKRMAPNDHFYQEKPLGEMLYPSTLVGYSKVTVRSIENAYGTDKAPQIGRTEYEFYTNKDFPIIEQRTALTKEPYQNDLIDDFTIVTTAYTLFHAVQGHTLKFNDMHGKLKSVQAFGEDNITVPVSGSKYFYKQTAGPGGSYQLVTSVPAVTENGVVTSAVSRDVDVTVDARENINESTTMGNQFLLELDFCNPFVHISDNITYGKDIFGVRMASNTKIVQQYGILERSESFDNKTKSLTKNLLWDANTGNVVMSSSTNDFNQITYNLNYPAYWMYPGLSGEYKRIGVTIEAPASPTPALNPVWNITTGIIKRNYVAPAKLLVQGDEVAVYDQTGNKVGDKYWVLERTNSETVTGSGIYNYHLVDAGGVILSTATSTLSAALKHYIKILRPAERNQTTLSAGNITTVKTQPLINGINQTSAANVISASATEYCQYWDVYDYNAAVQFTSTPINPTPVSCLPLNMNTISSNIFNPYTSGYLGRWQVWKEYQYNIPRTYNTQPVNQPNAKNDGVFASYTPFWKYATTTRWIPNDATTGFDRWVINNENTVFSPEGNLLESKDAIGVFHAQRYGYNHTMQILKASNAKVSEVGFDSFEEFTTIYPSLNYLSPTASFANDHLQFNAQVNQPGKPIIDGTQAHMGRFSLGFAPNASLSFSCTVNKMGDYISTHPTFIYPSNLVYLTRCGFPNNIDAPQSHTGLLMNFAGGKKYIASFWVKANTPALDYTPAFNVSLTYFTPLPVPSTANILPTIIKSPIINGWQKFDYEFVIPGSFSQVPNPPFDIFNFVVTAQAGISFDDFRIQPYNSSMTCTVYDPFQLRPWAQLDDRNYATIMEYDNQGMLVRKKKETEKGIFTLQETRKSTIKK